MQVSKGREKKRVYAVVADDVVCGVLVVVDSGMGIRGWRWHPLYRDTLGAHITPSRVLAVAASFLASREEMVSPELWLAGAYNTIPLHYFDSITPSHRLPTYVIFFIIYGSRQIIIIIGVDARILVVVVTIIVIDNVNANLVFLSFAVFPFLSLFLCFYLPFLLHVIFCIKITRISTERFYVFRVISFWFVL